MSTPQSNATFEPSSNNLVELREAVERTVNMDTPSPAPQRLTTVFLQSVKSVLERLTDIDHLPADAEL